MPCTSIQYYTGSPKREQLGRKKIIRGIQVGKEAGKLFLFTDDMAICIENPEECTLKKTQNLLELISEFSEVVGYESVCRDSLHFYMKGR